MWRAQRLRQVPAGKRELLPWTSLQEQFGPGYVRLRDFRRGFLDALRQVNAVYPTARLSADDRGLTLDHSPPPVTGNSDQVLLG